jgi:hypothetical protein
LKRHKKRIRDRVLDVFFSTVELEAGPGRKLRVRAVVLFILIPLAVAAACILKKYGVF